MEAGKRVDNNSRSFDTEMAIILSAYDPVVPQKTQTLRGPHK